ncbi:hypothetical protein ACWC24_11755 [Streptomyces sp. NPDC001443]
MDNGTNPRPGKLTARGGAKASAAAERASKQEAELRRRRALLEADYARDAELRRNGLGVAPVRAEKPVPAAPGRQGLLGKRAKKRPTRGLSLSAAPAVRAVPVADRGVDRRQNFPKIAPAYMLLTAADLQRERRREQARKKKQAERLQAKQKAQSTEKSGTPGTGTRRAKASGTGSQATKPRPR